MKFNKFVNVSGKFHGSTNIIQEDIIVMLSHRTSTKRKQPPPIDADDTPTPKLCRDSLLFIIHYQTSDKVKYKGGDKK